MGVVLKVRATQVSQETNAWGPASPPVKSNKITLTPVSGPGNEEWSQATPAGRIEFTVTNPDAFGQIEAGKDYLVRIEPAPVEEPPADEAE